MTSVNPAADGITDSSLRGRWWRRWHVIVPVIAVLLAIGAAVLYGPIGVGNGPLTIQMLATEGWNQSVRAPAGFILPMYNSGDSPAVVDSVDLVGGTRYGSPRLLALAVLDSARCGGAWPARATSRGFVMVGCGGRDHGLLAGARVPPTTERISSGFPAAAMAAPPPPGTCWVMTKVVLHYHVGYRYYAATDPFQLVVCAPGVSSAQTDAATKAAEGLG